MDHLDRIQDSLDYIEENLKASITPQELSSRAGFSHFHYCRLFQQAVGIPVKQYIIRRRLQWAAYEISQGRKQVEAALDYGFDTAPGLYKAFVRTFGCGPGEYVRRFPVCKPYRIQLLQGEYIMIPQNNLRRILSFWDLENAAIGSCISSTGEVRPNVYLVDGKYILKIFTLPGTAAGSAQIADALHRAGICETGPLRTKTGVFVAVDGALYGVLTEQMNGAELSAAQVITEPEMAWQLGKIIGQLHLALREQQMLCNDRDIYEETKELWLEPARQAAGLSEAFCAQYREIFGALHPRLPRQLIHRDPNPGNILFRDGNCVGFVDFDLSQRSIRLFDPCYAATAILSEDFEGAKPVWKDIYQGILQGYDSVVGLTAEEKQAAAYVVYSIELICVGFFSTQEKYARQAQANIQMLRWLMENREILALS